MNGKWVTRSLAAVILASLFTASSVAQDAPAKSNDAKPAVTNDDPKDAAPVGVTLVRAAKASKYVFVFAYRAEDEPTKAARKALDTAMEKLNERAITAALLVTDPLEKELVAKYGLDRAPLPLILAIAPNGAVTRSFTGTIAPAQFETAFVSAGMQKCLKALQDRKLVLISVQNDKTQHNAEALKGVKEFAADPQNAKTTELVTLDPTDKAEEAFLKQIKVDPKTTEAVTVFMAPPGTIVATYQGETKKDTLVAAAKTAAKGCDPKSGCCPAPAAKPAAAPQQPAAPEKK